MKCLSWLNVGLMLASLLEVNGFSEFEPPQIFPENTDHITVKAQQNVTFRCLGTLGPVSWRLPPDAKDDLDNRVSVSYTSNHRYHISEIKIRDLFYEDTGTFVCAYNGTTDFTAIDNSSAIHLYVEDGKHLLL